MPKSFCSNAGLPGSFTNALSYDEQIQFLIDKYNKMADVINNLKIDVDISDVVKYIPQTGFSEIQKQQARNNIGAEKAEGQGQAAIRGRQNRPQGR